MRRPPGLRGEPTREAASTGRFVCLEGIDGAGKTTAVAGAAEVLNVQVS